jgi:hypothetical protein
MADGKERRVYRRSEEFNFEVRVSRDNVQWLDVDVYDLSSEGLKFQTDEQLNVDDVVWFDLKVTKLFAEFKFTAAGVIRRKDGNVFGASFKDLSEDIKIRIDEVVHKFGPTNIMY